jgi:23S rRNA G2445 N2-methylase RlmL
MVNISKDNAKIAGVDNIIKFSQKDFLHENIDGKEKLRIISNPPY